MKAVVITRYGGVETLAWQDVPEPRPGPGDLLVRIRAGALNRADILQRQGLYPPPEPRGEFEIPGLEFAGEVESIGQNVSGFTLGDRVMGITVAGGQAEKLAVPAGLAMRVPANFEWTQAASIPEVFITAHDALLRQGALCAGESVLIHAAGSGVGIAAIQVAKGAAARPVIGTAGSETKLAQARELGLDVGIDYRQQDFVSIVREATAGMGVNVIVDLVGARYWDSNIRALALKGRLLLIGLLGGTTTQINLGTLLAKRLTIRGTTLRSRSLQEKIAATRAFESWGLPLLASGRMQPVIDSVYSMSQIREAHCRMESNTNFGKIVLLP